MRGCAQGVRRGALANKPIIWAVALASIMGGAGTLWGCSSSESSEGQEAEDSKVAVEQKAPEEWAAYLPEVITKEDGTQVQKTPYGTTQFGVSYPEDWQYYNTYRLDADKRGCSSCHDLEDVMKASSHTYWYVGAYENEEMTFNDCFPCHYGYGGVEMQDALHAHMGYEAFTDMGGSCNSCHYIDSEGSYLLWDDVKYDVMHGISDVDAESVEVTVEWNQDEITPTENMFRQRKAAFDYKNNIVPHTEDIRSTYTVQFHGAMDNPCEMTIQEMIDKFGTETRVLANQCAITGTGSPYIYQAEVTGIPVNKVLDYLELQEGADYFSPIGAGGYVIPVFTDVVRDSDALLVFEMNGEELSDDQGYPLSIWMGNGLSGAHFTRYLSEIEITSDFDPKVFTVDLNGIYGDNLDTRTGGFANTPNIGVLTAESGQIFPAGQPVHLEGYAHAFDETVTKLEFSFDHGKTWVEVPTDNVDNERWVYWKMDIESFTEPGAYLMELRATCVNAAGETHVNQTIPQFLINIQ